MKTYNGIPIPERCIPFENKQEHLTYCANCEHYNLCPFSYLFVNCKEFQTYCCRNYGTIETVQGVCARCAIRFLCHGTEYYDVFQHTYSSLEGPDPHRMIETNYMLESMLGRTDIDVRGWTVDAVVAEFERTHLYW